MVGERESSQVQWGAVSAAPQVAPCAVNRCPSNALTCLQQGLSLGGDTGYGSILGDDYRAQSVWQQGGAFNPPVLLQVLVSFLHSPSFSKAVSVPRCLRAAGVQRVAETRPPQRGRHESRTFDGWKSYILTALLRTVQAFCSQANISLFLSI